MAKKISELDPHLGSAFAIDDKFVMVDKSENETKRVDISEAIIGLGLVIGTDVQAWSSILDNTTAAFLVADETKLDALDQGVATTDDPTFNDITASGGIFLGGSAAANKLDDYEEGTWTPVWAFGGASVGLSYTVRQGVYTKIGNLVTETCHLDLAAKGTSTGVMTITGLPFTSDTTASLLTAASVRPQLITFADTLVAALLNNSTSISVNQVSNGGSLTDILNTNCNDNSRIILSITYRAA